MPGGTTKIFLNLFGMQEFHRKNIRTSFIRWLSEGEFHVLSMIYHMPILNILAKYHMLKRKQMDTHERKRKQMNMKTTWEGFSCNILGANQYEKIPWMNNHKARWVFWAHEGMEAKNAHASWDSSPPCIYGAVTEKLQDIEMTSKRIALMLMGVEFIPATESNNL
ncbi:hypothetical protein ACJX0J_006461, partial [Zea mays]